MFICIIRVTTSFARYNNVYFLKENILSLYIYKYIFGPTLLMIVMLCAGPECGTGLKVGPVMIIKCKEC